MHTVPPKKALPFRRLLQSNFRNILRIGEGPAADLHRRLVTEVSPTLRNRQWVPGVATPIPRPALRSVRTGTAARRMRTRGRLSSLPPAECPVPAQSRAPPGPGLCLSVSPPARGAARTGGGRGCRARQRGAGNKRGPGGCGRTGNGGEPRRKGLLAFAIPVHSTGRGITL